MGRKNYWFLVVILLAVLSIFICTNIPFQLGLDLRGGSQLTLEVQPTEEIPKITPTEIEGVKAVLDKRVNGLGVSDSQLQTVGKNQLLFYLLECSPYPILFYFLNYQSTEDIQHSY